MNRFIHSFKYTIRFLAHPDHFSRILGLVCCVALTQTAPSTGGAILAGLMVSHCLLGVRGSVKECSRSYTAHLKMMADLGPEESK